MQYIENYELEGKRLPAFTFPHPHLTKKCEQVTDFDESLRELAMNMAYTMYLSPAVGLAANQVGYHKRVIVVDVLYDLIEEESSDEDAEKDYSLDNMRPYIFINPEIIEKKGSITWQEGCVSLPGIYENIDRSETVSIRYQDLNGKEHTHQASGHEAVCIQHEIDHLNGITFLDYLGPVKKGMYRRKLQKLLKKGRM